MSASPVVVVDTPRAGVGRIVLSRRIKRNAINHEMVELIEAGLASFVQSGVGVAVLSGDGDVFSAGADLTEVGGPRPPAADRLQALLVRHTGVRGRGSRRVGLRGRHLGAEHMSGDRRD